MMICRDDRHCPLCSDDCEAYIEVVSASIFDQIRWERDVALEQLNELGLSFGEKPRHGQWTMSSDIPDTIICSNCHEAFDVWKVDINRYHFCPNCGAKMDVIKTDNKPDQSLLFASLEDIIDATD